MQYIIKWRGSSDGFDPYGYSTTFTQDFADLDKAIQYLCKTVDFSYLTPNDIIRELTENWGAVIVIEKRKLNKEELDRAVDIICSYKKELEAKRQQEKKQREIEQKRIQEQKEYELYLELKEKFEKPR